MRHGSLFSGIGGFDLAAEWMEWENVFHCEINKYCQKVLKQHFPKSILYENIKKTDFKEWNGKIDIISGGFPCQPFSPAAAGRRKGTKDERYLWSEMLRAIGEIQPRWVVGENVRGIINWDKGMVFDKVQNDLEAMGYEILPFLLPAGSVEAPHRRDRIWFIAHSDRFIRQQRSPEKQIQRESSLLRFKFKGGFEDFRNRWSLSAPRTCGNHDGIPDVVDRIKALGNAVVPQVVYQIFKAIEQYENSQPPLL